MLLQKSSTVQWNEVSCSSKDTQETKLTEIQETGKTLNILNSYKPKTNLEILFFIFLNYSYVVADLNSSERLYWINNILYIEQKDLKWKKVKNPKHLHKND